MLVIRKRSIIKNLAIFLCCGAAGWYLKARLTPQNPMMMGMGAGEPYVLTTKVTQQNIAPKKSYIGHVEAIKSVDLRPQITGYVEKVLFKEGSFVQEGDILFIIEQQRYLANLKLAEADLAKAEANLVAVEKDYKRQASLNKQKFASEARLDDARNNLAQAKAAVKQAQANLDLAKINVDYTTIKAPVSGYIGKALATEGNYVNSSSEILARIVQINPIRVAFSISDKELIKMRKHMDSENPEAYLKSELILPNGDVLDIQPKSRFTDNEIQTETATIAIYDEYENDKGYLMPGNYIQVVIGEEKPNMKNIIPQAAISQDAHGNYVVVVNAEGIAEQRRVELGDTLGEKQIVNTGLKAGEDIVIQGLQKVKNGQKVKADSIAPEVK